MNRDRHVFDILDGVRGVAAILVMAHHLPFLNPFHFQGAYLAVDLFFVLSGVVICNAYESRIQAGMPLRRFLWIRIVRLYPLYILGSAVTAAGLLYLHKLGLVTTILGAAMLPDLRATAPAPYPLNRPAWSLFFEMVANAAFFFIVWTRRPWLHALAASMGLLGLVYLAFVAPQRLDVGWAHGAMFGGIYRVAYSFFVGVLLFKWCIQPRVQSPSRPSTVGSWLLMALATAMLCAPVNAGWRGLFDLVAVVAVFPLLTLAGALAKASSRVRRACSVLGTLSYPIYALHVPVGLLYVNIRARVFHEDTGPGPIGSIGFLVVFLVACWLLARQFDEPVRKRLVAQRRGVALAT